MHRWLFGIWSLLLVSSACSREARVSPSGIERAPSGALYHPEAASDAGADGASLLRAAVAASELVHPLTIPGIRFVVESAIRRGELPGAVVAIGDRRGLRYLRAFGERTVGEAMTTDTRFDLASLTKPFTAAAIMMLAERGVIDLRAPASSYLRELQRPDKRGITLAQLLLHTSGLPKVNPLSACEHGRAQARASIARERLLTPPGAQFEYSDLGFILLGEVVEGVTSMSLDAFTGSQLFVPLGMRDTAFRPAPGEAMRCAPTELREDVLIRGVVDDPRAFRLDGVAGHAGVFSTAEDLARFARMLLNRGELDGVRVLRDETVATFTAPHAVPGAVRSLGFDVQSSYALGKGRGMAPSAFGHGGYTGTSLWIDPVHDVFVIFLSNRVHVGPKGNIHPLASSVADLALRARRTVQTLAGEAPRAVDARSPARERPTVKVGIDVLEEEQFARLRGRKVAVLSHLPARDAKGSSTVEVIAHAREVTLRAIFSPEHGLAAHSEGKVASTKLFNVPVHSLFGKTRTPTPEMLAGVDTVVIDLVDVGTRFYTYMATALGLAEAAGAAGIDVVLLDRPNPLGGTRVEGPLSEPAFASFVNYHPLPLRHGMTAGELLSFLMEARALPARPHVVEVEGWRSEELFAETSLRWSPPSPNLPTPTQALLYPAIGLVEGTNVSVGRGTPRAFSVLGAPFVKGAALAEALRAAALPGLAVEATRFRPLVGPYQGKLIEGVSFEIRDPRSFSAARTGLAIAQALRTLYAEQWDRSRLGQMFASQATLEGLEHGLPLDGLVAAGEANLPKFLEQRLAVLIYPR
jgi:uncharacterized protein YbbC (DUF1343 family)/CubicO group peptidase (beta-lactamase class C family)